MTTRKQLLLVCEDTLKAIEPDYQERLITETLSKLKMIGNTKPRYWSDLMQDIGAQLRLPIIEN